MSPNNPSALINGMGPGISTAVARRFGRAGFAIQVVGRTKSFMSPPTMLLSTTPSTFNVV